MNTPRAEALIAALQDLARDLEADLGKAARYRGYDGSNSGRSQHRDPGENLTAFEAQKATFTPPLRALLASYSTTANAYGEGINTLAPDYRGAILELIEQIHAVTTHDDAIALVGTFTTN